MMILYILILYINTFQFRSFQMPRIKMFNFHGQHDGAKRLISLPTAHNRNFTVNV